MRLLLLLLILACSTAFGSAAAAGFSQNLGSRLPAVTFTDESGATTSVIDRLGGKPGVIVFSYLRCPQLCSVVSEAAGDSLRALQLSVGRDFAVITVSIDPTDTPAMAREWQQREVARYGRSGAGAAWHVLTGRADSIAALAQAAGFAFSYEPRSRQYAHPTGIVIVTAQGVVSRYLLGVDYPAKDLSRALVNAGQGRVGPRAYDLILDCLEGGLPGGRYGRLIWGVLTGAVALTVLAVFGGIAAMLAQEFRRRRTRA